MHRRLLLISSLIFLATVVFGQTFDTQNYRTYDGKQNNLNNHEWGSAGVNLLRVTEIGYPDSISSVGGTSRPNPRTISNDLFAQDNLLNDPLNLSDYCWVWGQFIDHDIGITSDAHDEDITISVPAGDPWFDPNGFGSAIIPMARSKSDPLTGTGPDNPRQHPNEITAFIDGSAVYGSDEDRANWLRTFNGGKLKTSAGNLLPFNTLTGELDAEIDPGAPEMANPTGLSEKIFVAGDVRANENVLLLSFHTLFVREHNRVCDDLATQHPDWTDEQLYQHARKIVGGIIQAIVYEEWLPAMGVDIDAYSGYKSDVNPGLFNVFTAAAFRLGHTLLNGEIKRMNNDGEEMAGQLELRNAFFNPLVIVNSGGIEPFLKGMAVQVQQDMDHKVIDDVRNFLFGPPGAGGLDLASINIQRGRERGLPHFNSVRQTFGLEPYHFYGQINSDASVFVPLLTLYNSVDNIDPWVGMLAEAHMPGTLFGPTIMKIMEVQFTRLRDGDRFFYLNDPVLSPVEKVMIQNTTLHDVIMRNTGITLMQDNVFDAMPHEEICGNMTSEVAGNIRTEEGLAVPDVMLNFITGGQSELAFSDADGNYSLDDLSSCGFESLQLSRDDNYANGVSTLDMVFISQHILGIAALDSPYKLLAADVNNSGSISTLDLIAIRKLVLTVENNFPNVPSWRFIAADYVFQDETNPFDEAYQEFMSYDILPSELVQDFIAIKMGDVNGSANPENYFASPLENRTAGTGIQLNTPDMQLQAGESYEIAFSASDLNIVAGFQFSLRYDAAVLEFERIGLSGVADLKAEHLGHFPQEGLITAAWNAAAGGPPVWEYGDKIFALRFRALDDVRLSRALSLGSYRTRAVAYTDNFEPHSLDLAFSGQIGENKFELYQNQPNPFTVQTIIPFHLSEDSWAKLSIFDVSGKVLFTENKAFNKGYNEWTVFGEQLAANGLIYYRLETKSGTAVRKMVLSR